MNFFLCPQTVKKGLRIKLGGHSTTMYSTREFTFLPARCSPHQVASRVHTVWLLTVSQHSTSSISFLASSSVFSKILVVGRQGQVPVIVISFRFPYPAFECRFCGDNTLSVVRFHLIGLRLKSHGNQKNVLFA